MLTVTDEMYGRLLVEMVIERLEGYMVEEQCGIIKGYLVKGN